LLAGAATPATPKEDIVKRLTTLLIALGFSLGSLVGAQQEPAQSDETDGERAQVRFVHAAPNASVAHVLMTSDREAAGGVAITRFGELGYATVSDYVSIPAGSYDVFVVLEAVEGEELARVVPAQTFDAAAGGHYTVALAGLVIPPDIGQPGPADEAEPAEEGEPAEDAEPAEEGEQADDAEAAEQVEPAADAAETDFMAWLQGLFAAPDADQRQFDLRLIVLDDDATATLDEQEMHVRILHAAAGSQPVSLAVHRADDGDAEANGEAEADAAAEANGEAEAEAEAEANGEAAEDAEAAEEADVEADTQTPAAEGDFEIVQTVAFAEASEYVSLRSEDRLEIRTEDGEAVVLDLGQYNLEPGMLHTIVVTGTPVQEVPLEAVIASTRPAQVERADDEAAEAEAVDGEAAEAEAVDGEAAEAEAVDGEAAEAEAVDGEAAEAEAVDGEAAEAEAVDGEAALADDPDAEATEEEREAVAAEPREDAAADEVNGQDVAMVRFVNAAPNAEIDQVMLTDANDAGLVVEEFGDADYASVGEYVSIPAGSYDVTVMLAGEGAETDADAELTRVVQDASLDANAGEYYTIVLTGLLGPEQVGERAEADDDGFFGWLQDLFTTDPEGGELTLRLLVIDDEAATAFETQEQTLVRVVHVAPGTEPVTLTVHRAADDDAEAAEAEVELLETVGYADVSGYASVHADDRLELRTEDGEAVILDLADESLEPGMLHTIFVTGTPVEEMPIEAVVASTEPRRVADDAAEAQQPQPAAEEPAAEEPAAEEPAAEEPAADAETRDRAVATQPGQPATATQPAADHAMVRFVHAAPTAGIDEIMLTTGDDAVGAVTLEQFADTEYMDVTEYVAIPAGSYDIVVSMSVDGDTAQAAGDATSADLVRTESFTANANAYYTLAFVGLVVPTETAEQQDGGFFDWLQDLFTDDPGAHDDFALRVMVIDDHFEQLAQDQMNVRIVHAAPGTQSLALVQLHDAAGADVDVHQTVAYGEVSGYSTVALADGPLVVRLEGSEVVLVDLSALEAAPGMMHTVYVTGTPVEEVPIDAVVLSTSWQEQEQVAPAN
jgi:hypothetical protein